MFKSNSLVVKEIALEEDNSQLYNPSRGWYEIYSFAIEQEIDFDELIWSLREDETIALVVIDIAKYRDDILDEGCLDNLNNILDFFSSNGKDIILRFTYDRTGCANLYEPNYLELILKHIEQAGETIVKYSDSILTCQGMFVGNWGEMHGSKYLSDDCLIKLFKAYYKATNGKVFLAVRRPVHWRSIFSEEEKNVLNNSSLRLGLFDDGLFGSSTHLGTFADKQITDATHVKNKQWNQPWVIDDELEFEDKLCMNVPNGGEAVCSNEAECISAEETVGRFRKMHISYLNCAHDMRILDSWKQQQFNGMSLYDYVGLHLGYRLIIKSVKIKKTSKLINIKLIINNVGFAPLYNKSKIFVLLVDDNDKVEHMSSVDIDVNIIPGKDYCFHLSVPLKPGRIYIKMQRLDGKNISFANKCSGLDKLEGQCGFGILIGYCISSMPSITPGSESE